MKFGVIVFPGSNCDKDCHHAVSTVLGQQAEYIWHQEQDLDDLDVVILPGGFTYGDYLRAGAIARFAPVMDAVERFAARGGLVLGICNGFQILCEAGLLPGALLRNDCLQFRCEWVNLRVDDNTTPFTTAYRPYQVVKMPIAHGEGRYYADEMTLAQLEHDHQIVFRYCRPDGILGPETNPNGSLNNIAGICSKDRNVLGLMPHPERCSEAVLGGSDGLSLFLSLIKSISGKVTVSRGVERT